MIAQQQPFITPSSTFIIQVKQPHTPSIKVSLINHSKLFEVMHRIIALMPNNKQIYGGSDSYLQFYHAIPYQPQSEIPIIQEFSKFRHQYNPRRKREQIEFKINKDITVGRLDKLLKQLSGSIILQLRWKSIFTLIHCQIQMGCFLWGQNFKPYWNLKQLFEQMAFKALTNQDTEDCDKQVFREVRDNIQDYYFLIGNTRYHSNTQVHSINKIFQKQNTHMIQLNLIYKRSNRRFTGH